MAQHDRYETDILKQLTRIANALEKIEKKTQAPVSQLTIGADGSVKLDYESGEFIVPRNCTTCRFFVDCGKCPNEIEDAENRCCTNWVEAE